MSWRDLICLPLGDLCSPVELARVNRRTRLVTTAAQSKQPLSAIVCNQGMDAPWRVLGSSVRAGIHAGCWLGQLYPSRH